MAQTSISGFYPVKKRANGDHTSVKRRKLTNNTRLDIPVIDSSADVSSSPVADLTKVRVSVPSNSPVRQSNHAKRKTKSASRKKRVDNNDSSSIRSLFESISHANKQSLLETSLSTEPATKTNSQVDSVLRLPPSPPTAPPSLHQAQPPHSPNVRTILPSSPIPSRGLTRGAALVELARQRMVDKIPCKEVSESPSNTIGVRRKLLSGPSVSCQSLEDGSSNTSRTQMVHKVHKPSARELALPTHHELRVKSKRESKGSGGPALTHFKSIVIDSPKKELPDVQPAYQRFSSLVEPSPKSEEPNLPLPQTYQLLCEKFRCTDTIVNMLQKRVEICTFSKLKRAVQEMCRREFEERNLAQMKTVCPNAFIFRQETNIPGCHDSYSKYQLTVQCNTADCDGSPNFLNPSDLIKRKQYFHKNLVSVVREKHQTFLSQLTPPLNIPENKVLRWHPDFKLDCLPEVEESDLPRPPVKETYSGAADVLKSTQSRLSQRVRQALADAAHSTTQPTIKPQTQASKDDPSLWGVSKALVDKIRAKEAAKAEATITRDPLSEKQLEMISRLPEFVRIIRAFFIAEKKAALFFEDVVSKLSESHPSRLAKDRVEDHLHYLCQIVPHWVSLVTIRKRKYIKIDRKSDIKAVLQSVEHTRIQLNSHSVCV